MLKINFLGDSITEGCLASKRENTFVYLVGKMTNSISRNYGIGGTRFARQKEPSSDPKYDRYFASRILEMDKDADYVFVFGGTNDYGHGDAPIGQFGDKTLDTFAGAVDFTINELLKYFKKEQVVFIPPLYRVNEDSIWGSHDSKTVPCPSLKEYRKLLIQIVNSYNITLLDISEQFGKAENNPLLEDGLHPNDLGHRKLAELISDFLISRR